MLNVPLLYRHVGILTAFARVCLAAHLYLIGDSTMMPAQGDTVGRGSYAERALTDVGIRVSVVNEAVSGMSARTTFEQGKFQAVADQVVSDDFVLIELGRNDYVKDNNIGRQSCPPITDINTTCMGGKKTFEAYIIDAATSMQAKNASVILASLLPLNPYGAPIWDFDPKESPPVFITYTEDAARRTRAAYIDLYTIVTKQYHALPEQTVRSFFGANDSVHTNAAGAQFVAKQVAQALVPVMGSHATRTSAAVPGETSNSFNTGNCTQCKVDSRATTRGCRRRL